MSIIQLLEQSQTKRQSDAMPKNINTAELSRHAPADVNTLCHGSTNNSP